jgi:hypothetical protein
VGRALWARFSARASENAGAERRPHKLYW